MCCQNERISCQQQREPPALIMFQAPLVVVTQAWFFPPDALSLYKKMVSLWLTLCLELT